MQMGRRDFLKLAGLGACLQAVGCESTAERASQAAAGKRPPNIVLCMADDQGWGEMAYNGHPLLKTPNFDAMAKAGVRFDRFYAAAPVCSPTRGSVMTGRHPNRFGCFSWGHTLRPREITIAEALKEAGYVTGHFGKWHLGSVRIGSQVNPGASGFDEWLSAPNFFENDPLLSREGTAIQTYGESSQVTADAAIEFIRKHAVSEQPFLAVVWFGSPHQPHIAVDRDREPYGAEQESLQHFYGEITGMDHAFGALRAELRNLGIHEETILWYCSDNGGLPRIGSTGGRGHKGDIYEGGLRVPALLEWPAKYPDPVEIAMPCNTTDIYPTLLEIADVQPEGQPQLDGISLVGALEGTMKRRPEPIGFWQYPESGVRTPSQAWMEELMAAQATGDPVGDSVRLRPEAGVIDRQYSEESFPGHSAWLDWPWKLHRIQPKDGTEVKIELYNLAGDPGEQNDKASQQPVRAKKMLGRLENWQKSVVRSLNGKDYP
jgi:arylsulfatase